MTSSFQPLRVMIRTSKEWRHVLNSPTWMSENLENRRTTMRVEWSRCVQGTKAPTGIISTFRPDRNLKLFAWKTFFSFLGLTVHCSLHNCRNFSLCWNHVDVIQINTADDIDPTLHKVFLQLKPSKQWQRCLLLIITSWTIQTTLRRAHSEPTPHCESHSTCILQLSTHNLTGWTPKANTCALDMYIFSPQ